MIKVSESLNGAIENFLELTPQINEHMEKNNNPHAVTKTQIGLANVVNEKQATAAQYIGHIQGADKHRAEDILYDDVSLKEKIESISGQISGETEQELAEVKEDVAQIKNELEKGSIILTGNVITNTPDSMTLLPLEGDERFVSDGFLNMPPNSAANFECIVIVTDGEGNFMKSFVFEGYCMNCRGAIIFASKDGSGEYGNICDDISLLGYTEALFGYNYGANAIHVAGDDRTLYWKATVEIKNFMQISN